MTSLPKNTVADYRARAQKARDLADLATEESARQALLRDAELFERMATFAEKAMAKAGRAPG